MLQTEIAVIGAGPAGLAAAVEASLAGAKVTLVDDYARLGGQYFKQSPAAFKVLDHSLLGRGFNTAQELMGKIEQGRVEVFVETAVWAALEPGVLEIYRQGECQRLHVDRIIVATGAYERPIAFPGWTLPGVMTAGAAQTFVKSQGVLPGDQVLMVGSGPFQLPVAVQLAKAGATIVAVADVNPLSEWLRLTPAMWRRPEKIAEAIGYWARLRRAKVPLLFGWTICEARAENDVEQAIIVKVDDNCHPIEGTKRVLTVDTICLAFGFLPSLQLPRLLGCQSRWDAMGSYWATRHDADQRTSVPEIFVAGETTGIGGHEMALAEGAVAGAKAAADLGYSIPTETARRLAKARKELGRHRQFAEFLDRAFAVKSGTYDLITEDTIICRCEEVTAGEIAAAIREWGGNLRTIKQLTRVGMGQCQGRQCWPLVAEIMARASGLTIEEIGPGSLRPPIKPVPLGALATMPIAQR